MKLEDLVNQRDEINKVIILEKDKLLKSILELPENPNLKKEGKFLKTIQYKDLINWDVANFDYKMFYKRIVNELERLELINNIILTWGNEYSENIINDAIINIINELNYIIENKTFREINIFITHEQSYNYNEVPLEIINNLKALINGNTNNKPNH